MRAALVVGALLIALLAACSGSGDSDEATGPQNYEVVAKGAYGRSDCYVRYHLYGQTEEWRGTGADCSALGSGFTEGEWRAAEKRGIRKTCYAAAGVGEALPAECR